MKNITTYALIFFVLILFSCSKEKENVGPAPEPDPVPEKPACKLLLMKYTTSIFKDEAVYDAQGRVIKFNEFEYIYNNQDQVIQRREQYSWNVYRLTKYTWKGKVLAQLVTEVPEDKPTSRTIRKFTANSKGQIISQSYENENLTTKKITRLERTYTYDAAGNVISVADQMEGSSKPFIIDLTYDNQKSLQYFYRMITPEDHLAFSKNNIVSSKVRDVASSNYNYTYTYTYNSQGYPVKRKTVGENSESTLEYVYECK